MTGAHAASLLLAQLLCLSTAAQALTVQFSGAVDGLVDTANRLDGSVTTGTLVSGTYTVDPTPSGGSFGDVGAARLVFSFGSYLFDQGQDPHHIGLLDDTGPPIAPVDIWETSEIVLAQLDPAISVAADHVGYGAALQLFDFTATNLTGAEPAPYVPSDLADWSSGRLTLDSLIDDLGGGTMIGDLQMTVALQSWSVVPEARTGALLALGLVALAGRRRR
jgi:MYXO-CTERM domain-containing protein